MRIIHRALTTESDKVSLGTMIRNKDQRAARSYAKMMTREIMGEAKADHDCFKGLKKSDMAACRHFFADNCEDHCRLSGYIIYSVGLDGR